MESSAGDTEPNVDDFAESAQKSGDISLSIEETNKLREKLGLKPLDVGDAANQGKGSTKKEEVFVPTENMGDKKREEKIRRKLADFKESREIKEKLREVKGLGEGEEESATEWVQKLRKIQEEKKLAEKRARLLDEMDEEQEYEAKDLRGLKVQHDQAMFEEGRSVVLTLQDSDVLDSSGDVLVNVNMVDQEKVAKNLELKKGKPDYNPYEDEEVDEEGVLREKVLLKKYDELENPEEPKSFFLGSGGALDMEELERKKKLREMMKIRGESLDYVSGQVASDYFSQEEMVKFKKPRRKRKVARKVLKADDLLSLGEGDSEKKKDHGSRKRKRGEDVRDRDEKKAVKVKKLAEETREPSTAATKIKQEVDNEGPILSDDDEAESELQKALERSRRLQIKRESGGIKRVEEILAKVGSIKKEPLEESGSSGRIELSSIAEFCRTVGEDNSAAPNQDKLFESEENEEMDIDAEREEYEKKEDHATSAGFEAEPVVGSSIGAALQMASRKGLIEAPAQAKKFDKKFEFVERDSAKHVVIEASTEAGFQREFRDRRDRYDMGHHFREKSDYKPKVDLKYINEKGEEMTPKEAFRYLSHKFHGKNPGKLKLEKRAKKKRDNEMLKKMSCTDTPLNTVAMMQEKQKQSHAPFVVLSGGARQLASLPPVAKK